MQTAGDTVPAGRSVDFETLQFSSSCSASKRSPGTGPILNLSIQHSSSRVQTAALRLFSCRGWVHTTLYTYATQNAPLTVGGHDPHQQRQGRQHHEHAQYSVECFTGQRDRARHIQRARELRVRRGTPSHPVDSARRPPAAADAAARKRASKPCRTARR